MTEYVEVEQARVIYEMRTSSIIKTATSTLCKELTYAKVDLKSINNYCLRLSVIDV